MGQKHDSQPWSARDAPQPTDPRGSRWLDISVPLRNAMVRWPSDPPVRIERVHDMERGDTNNLSLISMGSHTGTHIDAPLHFVQDGVGVDQMPMDIAVGRARAIEIQDPESIKPEELARHRIRHGERLLLKTRNSSRVWQTDDFFKDFVFLSREAAHFLVERNIALVGVDYLSVGGYWRDGLYTHQILLGSGVWIIEGLDLARVSPGRYDFICLPLKLDQGDGAPARAIVRPVREVSKRGGTS